MDQSLKYRPDVDGLRALAIIPVVLYHLDFPFFSGGFVGVDVFFVISGFLITSIIYREMTAGHFSYAVFYERRIRRLFPALFAVIAATELAAVFLLLPSDFTSYSQSVVATTVFGANILFWKTAGYFDGPSATKPMLHAWSLSVEEQFYIVFPIALLIVMRYARQYVRSVFLVTMLVSLVASLLVVGVRQDAAFYLPMFRAWELLLGAALAINAIPCPSTQMQRNAMSLLGIGLILYSVSNLTAATVYPGVYALFPSVGSALIICAGGGTLAGSSRSVVAGVLGWRPLRFVGLISYSLYLWHWPMIVFTKYYAMRELTSSERVAVLATSTLLAFLSWRFVERPFRGAGGRLPRRHLFTYSALAMAMAILIGLLGHSYHGFPQRVPQDVAAIDRVGSQTSSWRRNCQNLPISRIDSGNVCALGKNSGVEPDFLLWGDSHALALAPAFDEIAGRKHRAGWFIGRSACPPLMGVERLDQYHDCRRFNEAVSRFLEQRPQLRTVFLAGRWGLHVNGSRYGREAGPPAVISPLGVRGNPEAFQNGLESTLAQLEKGGVNVVFIMDVPEVGWRVPSEMAKSIWYNRAMPSGPTLAAYSDRQSPVRRILDTIRARHDVRVFELAPVFCPAGRCLVERAGLPLYRDDNHLSTHGAWFASRSIGDLL